VPAASTTALGLSPSPGPSSIGARLKAAGAGAATSTQSSAVPSPVHDHLRTAANLPARAGSIHALSELAAGRLAANRPRR
jgi:hypothetical protein